MYKTMAGEMVFDRITLALALMKMDPDILERVSFFWISRCGDMKKKS